MHPMYTRDLDRCLANVDPSVAADKCKKLSQEKGDEWINTLDLGYMNRNLIKMAILAISCFLSDHNQASVLQQVHEAKRSLQTNQSFIF